MSEEVPQRVSPKSELLRRSYIISGNSGKLSDGRPPKKSIGPIKVFASYARSAGESSYNAAGNETRIRPKHIRVDAYGEARRNKQNA
jgi:hypothetical protein